jgi:hypothetical protein
VTVEGLGPISGTFPPEDAAHERPLDIPAHEGFDKAWEDAIKQAESQWHKKGDPPISVVVKVEYSARIDIWNPGGVGQYVVTISPSG